MVGRWKRYSPHHSPYLYPNGTDVFSANRHLLEKENLYNLFSGSVIIETIQLPTFLLRLFFYSVCTVTCPILVPSKTISLITSKLTNSEVLYFNVIALILQFVFRSPVAAFTVL